MTSNTSPTPYVATGSSEASDSNAIWEVFANGFVSSGSSRWQASDNTSPQWLQIDFSEKRLVNHVLLSPNITNLDRNPKNFQILGSDDEVNFTELKTYIKSDEWVDSTYDIIDTVNYFNFRFYRVVFLENPTTYNMIMGRIKFGYTEPTNKILISSSESSFESVVPAINEISPFGMTNYTKDEITVSSKWESSPVYNLFDGDTTTVYATGSNTRYYTWIMIDYGISTYIDSYIIIGRSSSLNDNPKEWNLLASKSGLFEGEEIILDQQTNQVSWTDLQRREFSISSPQNYRYYKLDVLMNVNGEGRPLVFSGLEMNVVHNGILKVIPSSTEQNFINYGMDSVSEKAFSSKITQRTLIDQSPTELGSGKVFKQTINTTQTPIKKASIE